MPVLSVTPATPCLLILILSGIVLRLRSPVFWVYQHRMPRKLPPFFTSRSVPLTPNFGLYVPLYLAALVLLSQVDELHGRVSELILVHTIIPSSLAYCYRRHSCSFSIYVLFKNNV
ncbi:hypothetical protein LZ31DRAFT_131700 [Colletotrichum somersetense]|nr:hypothetical protein LZ31DRAFT_131700 [Colletotrichum somersetense]